ncbi:MAG: non-heme iron oxygenase ferredoxin subunit [Caldilineaceae bacterium]|nr:non-heme iron oxygenase ferredoxin subunit [Caldilineaceae bacterium]
MSVGELVKVATVDEIPINGSKLVEIDDVRLAIFNINDGYYAIEDVCTHDGGPLVEGEVVNGHEVECPRHGARFDIRTGAALRMPAFEPTPVYDVYIQGEDLLVEWPR